MCLITDGTTILDAPALALGRLRKDLCAADDIAVDYRAQIKRSGYLDASRHGLDALRSAVEERLVTQDCEGIIQDHTRFLAPLFERNRRLCQRNISVRGEHLRDLGRSEERLQAQIGGIRPQLEMMQKALKAGGRKVKSQRSATFQTLERSFDTTWVTSANGIEKEL